MASASVSDCPSTYFCQWHQDNFVDWKGKWGGGGSYSATGNAMYNHGTSGMRVLICKNSNVTNCPISYSMGYATGHSMYSNQIKSHTWIN